MSVEGLWSDSVSVEEMNDVDFERRRSATSVTDCDGRYTAIAEAVGEYWGLGKSAATDRAMRLYLAHLIDTEHCADYRTEYEMSQLIPPKEWMDGFEKPTVSFEVEANESANLAVTLPPTIKEIVDKLIEEDMYDNFTDFVHSSLDWIVSAE